MSTEDRGSFETEWVRIRDEVFRKLGLEFSIRLSLLVSDEGMDPPGNVSDAMREGIYTVIQPRTNQIEDDLFNRSRTEGVGFYTFAMFEVLVTSNKLALEVIKSALREGRRQVVEPDFLTAIEVMKTSPGHWPIS